MEWTVGVDLDEEYTFATEQLAWEYINELESGFPRFIQLFNPHGELVYDN